MRRRIDRTKHLCEQIRIRQILLRNRRHREVEIQIDNAVRLEIRKEHLRPREIAHLERQTLRILANVRPCKDRDRAQCLLRVRSLLRRLQRRTGAHNLRNLVCTHRSLLLRQLRRLDCRPFRTECTARRECHESGVRIVEERLANQLLEVAVLESFFERGKSILIAQIVLRRTAVEPRLHQTNSVDQSLG